MPEEEEGETLWMNLVGEENSGVILNVEDDAYYVKREKMRKFVNEELNHGLPLDKLPEKDD